jgi:hypothetical protein
MTKLLEKAIARLRKMPDVVQDLAAERLLQHVDETPEPDELAAIDAGRRAFAVGEFTSLDQWRHDLELGDR